MGFDKAGYHIIWANDINKDACDTYDKWANYTTDGTRKSVEERTKIVCGDITKKQSFKDICPGERVEVVLGGFPCQGFSVAGPRQVDDSRNVLYRSLVKMVDEKRPIVFMAENVVGLRTLGDGAVFDKIIDDFKKCGYTLSASKVSAASYGVPEDRTRIIIIGFRDDISHGQAYRPKVYSMPRVTMGDVLRDVTPNVDRSKDVCNEAFSSRYMSRNRKRELNDISFTIPAMAKQVPLSPHSSGMHFVEKDVWEFDDKANTFRLSWQEAAAIQTFPAGMEFVGSLDSKYKQIGNAVPVKLAHIVANDLKEVLDIVTEKGYDADRDFYKISHWFSDDVDQAHFLDLTTTGEMTTNVITHQEFTYKVLIELYEQILNMDGDKSHIHGYKSTIEKLEKTIGPRISTVRADRDDSYRAARKAVDYILNSVQLNENIKTRDYTIATEYSSIINSNDNRDIIISIEEAGRKREIGISCRYNHYALKHPRIRKDPDFLNEWTEKEFKCSNSFIRNMKPIISEIEELASRFEVWKGVPKEEKENIYSDIIEYYVDELDKYTIKNATREMSGRMANALFKYVFGKTDFYQIIYDQNKAKVFVYPFNINGTLFGKSKKGLSPIIPREVRAVARIRKNTFTIDLGFWTVTMRIHNADSRITPTSLKFDVKLQAMPVDNIRDIFSCDI